MLRGKIGRLTLDEVQAAFGRGETPQQVADAAGVARQTLINRLACRGLRVVHRWDMEPITASAEVLEALAGRGGTARLS